MPLRVGWVDDTALIRQLAVRLIEGSGHTCRAFPRHVDLLEADREEPFDVIVLQPEDVVSPHSTRRRLLARCPRRAIALASGHPVERLKDAFGVDPEAFDRFIAKPFGWSLLLGWLGDLDTRRAGDRQPALPVMADDLQPARPFDPAWALRELEPAN